MNQLTFVPTERVVVIQDQVEDAVELVRHPERMSSAEAILLVRREEWAEGPLYYVLERDDFERLLREARLAELTRAQLFDFLDVHEETRAQVTKPGDRPSERAVELDPTGAVTGVWAPVEHAAAAAPPPDAWDRGMTVPAPTGAEPAPAPAPPAQPRNGAPADERRGVEEGGRVESLFRRTPHMDLSEPEPLAPGTQFTASVYLDTQEARPGESSEPVVLDLPEDLEQIIIDVMLAGTEHLEVKGESIKQLSMHREDERSPDVTFDVAVRDGAPATTPAALTAYLTYQHRPCGRVHRGVEIQGVAAAPEPTPDEVAPEPVAANELAIDARARPADLTVEIVRTPDNDGRHFLVTLNTTLIEDFATTEPEPWNFPQNTDAFVAAMMNQFTLRDASPQDRQDSLKGAGIQLWEAAPTSFQDLFWRLIDERQPLRTIYIASEEPHVPWELMRPRRELPSGARDQRDALGVEFVIGRWVHPGHRSPKQQDRIDDSYVLAPTRYRRFRPLQKAPEEAEWVSERFRGTVVEPAIRVRLDEMLRERPVGLLHFIAHGKADPNEPQTLLLDDDAVFNALQVRAMEGLESACRTKAPLVFLNACEVGRVTPALVGAGGFASEFVRAGARCVVAPIWSVKDSLAHEVAVMFYEAALEAPTREFADILREIRAKSYEAGGGEDTYAAYCFYGDPLTSLEPAAA